MDEFSTATCPKCEAKWYGGELYWSTGKVGCPHDLAGLVCNDYGDETCINLCKGSTSGQTWEQRREFIDAMGGEFNID
jgi:hypothetical protein